MAKLKKIGLKKVKSAQYQAEINGVEHTFEFTEFSAKQLSEMPTTLVDQHEAMKNNTACITDGATEVEKNMALDDLFEYIWENQPAGAWMVEMRELLGNATEKK